MEKLDMKTFLVLFFIFLSQNSLFAQNSRDDQMQRQIDEIMKAREEMLKSLMDDSFSGEMEKRMEDMIRRFGGPGFGSGSSGFGFGFDQMNSISVGSYDWDETETHKILKIKVTQSKDKPLDIKIENGMISLKGIAESVSGTGKNKVTSHMNFQKSFSLPTDIDQNNPEFISKEKEGEMWIKFKKVANKGTVKSGSKIKTSVPQNRENKREGLREEEERTPIKASEDDISI